MFGFQTVYRAIGAIISKEKESLECVTTSESKLCTHRTILHVKRHVFAVLWYIAPTRLVSTPRAVPAPGQSGPRRHEFQILEL